MKVGKPKSKRVPVRLRHKIEKASANKQRKQRKEAKKNPQWRSRLKKDPGIPNLFPYKDKVLAEIEESKRKKEEEQQRRRELARAQREGRKLDVAGKTVTGEHQDEDLIDLEDGTEAEEEAEDEMEEDTNPMAALLASAQARAHMFNQEDMDDDGDNDDDDDNDDEDGEESDEAHGNIAANRAASSAKAGEPARKVLPKAAVADPLKVVSTLVNRLETTQEGIQQLLTYYALPPLVTAGSDTTTRFLVDVARKRGRLGRGGVPNLHAAALTVLSDLNEERLKLPALQTLQQTSASGASNKSEVQIVSQMAQPFRIEGLFGESLHGHGDESKGDGEMEVKS